MPGVQVTAGLEVFQHSISLGDLKDHESYKED